MDGKIKIKLDIDTKTFESKLNDVKAKIRQNLDSTIGDDILDSLGDGSLEQLDEAYRKISEDIEMLRANGSTIENNSNLKEEIRLRDEILKLMREQSKLVDDVNDEKRGNTRVLNVRKLERSILKIGTALLGVRGVMGLLRRGVSAFMQQNEEMRKQIQGLWNALGEALSPAIEGLFNLLMKGVAIINLFIKALTGIDIVARANSKALANQNKQMKQLAGFDEMNKVSDGGSGGGASQLKLPELDDDLAKKVTEFAELIKGFYDNFLKPIVKWLGLPMKDKLESIKNNLDKILTICILITTALALLKGSVAGLVAIAIELIGYLVYSLWKNREKIFEDIKSLGGDILKFLKNLFWFIVDFIGVSVRNIIGIFGTIPTAIFGFFKGLFDGIVAIVKGEAKWSELGHYIIEGIGQGLSALWEWVADIWKEFIQSVKDLFGIHSPSKVFEEIGLFMVEGLAQGLGSMWERIKGIFTSLLTNVKDGFTNCWNAIKNGIGTAWDGIISVLKSKLNSVIGWVESMLNKLIDGANSLINKFNNNGLVKGINSILGTKLGFSTVGRVNLPRLAVGGIVNRPTQAIIGEAGKEAVLPLENNTGWMDELASKIGSNGQITIYVQMDGKTISKEIRKANDRYAFATNRG